jgi:hypothetical protein
MKSAALFTAALAAIVAAQDESLAPLRPTKAASSVGNLRPTATLSFPGPVATGEACGEIADQISRSRLQFPNVDAEVGFGLNVDESKH